MSIRARYGVAILCLYSAVAVAQPGRRPPQRPEDPFRFQLMGPSGGGRFSAVTGVPGDPPVWYVGSSSGATWKNVGLRETGRIGRIVVHPTNPNIVFVCALGRVTGPQQERGVFRTTDGGKTWQRVLFVDQNTGCSGLSIDAKHPSVLFAGM